jgi:hypothetical protein
LSREEGHSHYGRKEIVERTKEMKRETGTIFKVYLLAEGAAYKQEGFIELWKHKGKLQRIRNVPFDYVDELPRKMRRLLRTAKIQWPKRRSR